MPMNILPAYDAETVAMMDEAEKRQAARDAVAQDYDLGTMSGGTPYERRHDCSAAAVCYERQEPAAGFPERVSRPAYTDIARVWTTEDGQFLTRRDGQGDTALFRYQLLFSFDAQTRFIGETMYSPADTAEFKILKDGDARTLQIDDGTEQWTIDDAVREPAAMSSELQVLETLEDLYHEIYRPDDVDGDYAIDTAHVTDALDTVPDRVVNSFWGKVEDLEQNLALGMEPHQCQLESVNSFPALKEMYLGDHKVLWVDATHVPDNLLPDDRTLYAVDAWRDSRDPAEEQLHKHSEVRSSKKSASDTIRSRREKLYRDLLPADLLE